jgi:hypothetical protein
MALERWLGAANGAVLLVEIAGQMEDDGNFSGQFLAAT